MTIGNRSGLLSETGLYTNYRNNYYTKAAGPNMGKGSIKVEPIDNEYYALGVMILQMSTLSPIDQIDSAIRDKAISQIQGYG